MDIKINEQKILTEILERDGDLHEKIKEKVRQRLIDKCVDELESKFMTTKWGGAKEVWDKVLEVVAEKQTEIIKKILSEFYDSYKYGNKEADFVKKLKALISGEVLIKVKRTPKQSPL